MELRWIDDAGAATVRDLSELPDLLGRTDGFCWLDIPEWSDQAEEVLSQLFKFHPMAVESCRIRNHIPRVHVYPDHLFLVIHAPEIGTGGHVHYLELDQFIGEHYLVTVHGPLNPKVPLAAALRETAAVQERLERGRLRPTSPFGLTYAIVSSIARREAELTGDIARQVGLLEQRVMSASDEEPQEFLTELFTARHELLTIRTMAAQGGEIYRRAIRVMKFAQRDAVKMMKDVLDQYERVESLSQAQLNFLMGVTEFYRARTDTKMTIAAERLAVIAAVTLPITATSSIVGMNVIVNDQTHWLGLGILLGFMALMSGILLRWAKRQGWW
jgi:Mg2+ and Co2+ transporter CorA